MDESFDGRSGLVRYVRSFQSPWYNEATWHQTAGDERYCVDLASSIRGMTVHAFHGRLRTDSHQQAPA